MATPDGEQPISTLKVGDLVLAYDAATQTTAAYTVTATIHHTDTVVLDLVVGDEYLETTPEHPFFTAMRGWVDAQDLQAGDLVRQADGDYSAVQAVGVALRAQPMYNLTVATAHTFFVGDGQWLVHNAGCDETTVSLFKAPQPGLGRHQYENGYLPEDFTSNDEWSNNSAFFAKEPEVAIDLYAVYWNEGVIELRIDKSTYDSYLKQYESPYEVSPYTELEIPHEAFHILNEAERIWHTDLAKLRKDLGL